MKAYNMVVIGLVLLTQVGCSSRKPLGTTSSGTEVPPIDIYRQPFGNVTPISVQTGGDTASGETAETAVTNPRLPYYFEPQDLSILSQCPEIDSGSHCYDSPVLSFDDLQSGEDISTQFMASHGMAFLSNNGDVLVAYPPGIPSLTFACDWPNGVSNDAVPCSAGYRDMPLLGSKVMIGRSLSAMSSTTLNLTVVYSYLASEISFWGLDVDHGEALSIRLKDSQGRIVQTLNLPPKTASDIPANTLIEGGIGDGRATRVTMRADGIASADIFASNPQTGASFGTGLKNFAYKTCSRGR